MDIVKRFLDENAGAVTEMKAKISFEKDHEGKRLLNLQTKNFYSKKILTQNQISDIITSSLAIIEKMSELSKCDWNMSELRNQLKSGIEYYAMKATETYVEVDLPNNLRDKFPAKIRTSDGHYVRSKAEKLIDNFLYTHGIVHEYEKRLPTINEEAYCDFFIPNGKNSPNEIYIEFWGLENDAKYLEKRKWKQEIYRNYNWNLIEVNESHISNLEDYLMVSLLKYGIKFH